MKKEHHLIYYGILFSYLYLQIYSIISSLLISPVLSMHWNIYFIPIIISIFIVLLSLGFYHLKKFPQIKIWWFLLILLLSVIVKSFEWLPYHIAEESCKSYDGEERSLILKFTLYCSTLNTIIFIAIAYIKYHKIKKTSNEN